jgi:putative addiction module CopG family antidote
MVVDTKNSRTTHDRLRLAAGVLRVRFLAAGTIEATWKQASIEELTMAYQFPPDLVEQLKDRLATGQYASEDEVLREALRALKRQDEDVAAVKEAIADLEAGDRDKPFDEFIDEFRRAHQILQDA